MTPPHQHPPLLLVALSSIHWPGLLAAASHLHILSTCDPRVVLTREEPSKKNPLLLSLVYPSSKAEGNSMRYLVSSVIIRPFRPSIFNKNTITSSSNKKQQASVVLSVVLPTRRVSTSTLVRHCHRHRRRSYTSTNTTTMASSSSTNDQDALTSSHYQAHSANSSYEQAYFYEAGTYQQYLVDLVRDRLQLQPQPQRKQHSSASAGRHILDIGGGTGNFAQALLSFEGDKNEDAAAHADAAAAGGHDDILSSQHRITVVDPFLDPTTTTAAATKTTTPPQVVAVVSFVKESAETFLTPRSTKNNYNDCWRSNFHQVLLKEVVHHFSEKDRVGIFRGMYEDLEPIQVPSSSSSSSSSSSISPSLLIVTRPQTDIDYPLWDAARQVWKENQPSAEELCHDLEQAGFTDIHHTLEAYPCQIELSRWQSMIQQRFWSTFSNFSDAELHEACHKIIPNDYQDRIDSDGCLHFEDRLVLITATKK